MRPYDPNLDDPNAQDTTQSSVQTGAVAPGQTGAIGASGAEPEAGTSEQKSSGRWTNVNDYLNANRDSGLGSNLVGKVEGEVTGAKQTQTDAGTEFGQRVNSATTAFDPTLVGRATTDSANFVSNANDVAAFKNQRDAEYKGPNNFSDASDLFSRAQGATSKAAAKAGNLQSEGGRSQLLDNYFGRQGYNAGQKSLDGLVATSADPNAFAEGAARVGAGADSARSSLNQMAENLGAQASVARGNTENTRNQTRNALGITATGDRSGTGALGDLNAATQKQYTDAIAKRDADYGAAKSELGSPARDATLQRLGYSGGESLYGVDPTKSLFKKNTTAVDLTSAEQRSKMKALSQLSDLGDEYAGAGENPGELFGLDSNALGGRVATAKTQYEGLSKQITDSAADISSRRQEIASYLNSGGSKPIDFSPTRLNAEIAALDAQLKDLLSRHSSLNEEYGLPALASFNTTPSRNRA